MHGLHGAETVQALQVVHRGGEGVHGLQEGVIGELQRRVERNGRRQGLAPIFRDVAGRGSHPFFPGLRSGWAWGSGENPDNGTQRILKMAGGERESRDYYPSLLGMSLSTA